MMLPHQKKKVASLIVGGLRPSHDSSLDEGVGLETIASDILKAIEAKDVSGLSALLKCFFEECEASPHVEGPNYEVI